MPELSKFQWVRAKSGYELVPTDIEQLEKRQRRRAKRWAKERGYATLDDEEQYIRASMEVYTLQRTIIRPIGDEYEIVYPLQNDTLFMELADSEVSAAGMISFSNKYGLLLGKPDRPREEQQLSTFDYSVRYMKGAVSVWRKFKKEMNLEGLLNSLQELRCELSAELGPSADLRRPGLYLKPKDLMSAINLQFLQAVSTDTDLRQCSECKTWFSYGSGTGKRKTRIYCSGRCRQISHQRRHA